MTVECVVCGHPRWRSGHADWCAGVGQLLAPLSRRQPCSVDDCDRLSHARGWCKWHYTRWRRHGHPTIGLVTPLHTGHLTVASSDPSGEGRGKATATFEQHRPSLNGARSVSTSRPLAAVDGLAPRERRDLLVVNSKRADACNASSSTRAS